MKKPIEHLKACALWNEMVILPDIRIQTDGFAFSFSSPRPLSDEEIRRMEQVARSCLFQQEEEVPA